MATRVTVRIFSSRPNPVALLTGAGEVGFLRSLFALPAAPADAWELNYRQRVGGLGFRGFLIEPVPDSPPDDGPALASAVSLYGGIADYYGQSPDRLDPHRVVELQLLGVVLPGLDPPAARFARRDAQNLYRDPDCRGSEENRRRAPLPRRPAYVPGPWNGPDSIASNNCYNYANDERFTSGSSAVPGKGGGQPTPFGDCKDITEAVLADKLKALAQVSDVRNGWPIALFVQPGGADHHFYRQDKTGRWSHKPGAWPARDCDEGGGPILDILKADTLDYAFCGLFRTNAKSLIEG